MAKMKVYELAKELDVQSKDVVAYLTENGSAVKSHASNIEDKEIEMVRGKFGKKAAPAEKPAIKAEPVAPKAEPAKPAAIISRASFSQAGYVGLTTVIGRNTVFPLYALSSSRSSRARRTRPSTPSPRRSKSWWKSIGNSDGGTSRTPSPTDKYRIKSHNLIR